MHKPKKYPWDITNDATKQPGAVSRLGNHSLDRFFGTGKMSETFPPLFDSGMEKDPETKYGTRTMVQTRPGVILRKKIK